MGDDAATVEQLRAELRQSQDLLAECRAENAALRNQEAALVGELAESREQQSATAEVLRVIATSPNDLDRVLHIIARTARRLCGAEGATVQQREGDRIRTTGIDRVGEDPAVSRRRISPSRSVDRTSVSSRALIDRQTIHVPDIDAVADAFPQSHALAHATGWRSIVAAPLLHGGDVVGVLCLYRFDQAGPFSEEQIALLETFADQAALAIANARLFDQVEQHTADLTEALEQQTALGEVLRVIASSPTGLERVLQTVTEAAARYCGADNAMIDRRSGDVLRPAAWCGALHDQRDWSEFTIPVTREMFAGRAVLDRHTVHVTDISPAGDDLAVGKPLAQAIGWQSGAFAPLLAGDEAIGVLVLVNDEPNAFTNGQLQLLEAFADQAVIAIENARLFEDLERRNAQLQESNRQVTEALDQQTATSEVLKLISRSVFDRQPVLDTLVDNATKLCGADQGYILKSNGEVFQYAADSGATAEFRAFVQRNPVRPGRGAGLSRAALERRTVHIPDVLADPEYELHDHQRIGGYIIFLLWGMRPPTRIGDREPCSVGPSW